MRVFKTELKEASEVKGLFVIHECIYEGIQVLPIHTNVQYALIFVCTVNMNVNKFTLQHAASTSVFPLAFIHSEQICSACTILFI